MTTLAEGPDFLVQHFPQDVPIHVVWFSNMSDGRPENTRLPTTFLAEIGVGFSLVTPRRTDHWWCTDGFDAAMKALRDAIPRGRRVVTYGFSMGGYGALRFARLLDAERAVAFGPQDTITPALAPFETRWAWHAEQIGAPVQPARETFGRRTEYVVAYDPADPDALHVQRFREQQDQCGALRLIPLWFAGHNIAAKLHRAGALQPFARGLLLFRDEEVAAARNLYRALRRQRPDAAMRVQALRALARRGNTAALTRFSQQQRALILAGASADELMFAYLALRPHKLLEEAWPFVQAAAQKEPMVPRYAAHAADCLLRMGRKDEARRMLEPFAATADTWVQTLLHQAQPHDRSAPIKGHAA